jgi:hypothetical protein
MYITKVNPRGSYIKIDWSNVAEQTMIFIRIESRRLWSTFSDGLDLRSAVPFSSTILVVPRTFSQLLAG